MEYVLAFHHGNAEERVLLSSAFELNILADTQRSNRMITSHSSTSIPSSVAEVAKGQLVSLVESLDSESGTSLPWADIADRLGPLVDPPPSHSTLNLDNKRAGLT